MVMKPALKWILVIVLLFVGANAFRTLKEKFWKDNLSRDHKEDVIDSLIGRTAVDRYVEINEEKDTFNFPALKTDIMMFQTQHGRFPRDMEELENDGDASSDLTHDRFGNRYDMKILPNNILELYSAGRDKIRGTTDDVEYSMQL
jgi:hypothetical protein